MQSETISVAVITLVSGVIIGLIKTLHSNLRSSMKTLTDNMNEETKKIGKSVSSLKDNMNEKFSDLGKRLALSSKSLHYIDKEVEEIKADVKD